VFLLLIICVLVMSAVRPLPAFARSDINGCAATINNPHFSDGVGGIIAKGRYECTDVPSTIHINGNRGTRFLLWLCPHEPPKSESYLYNPVNGCSPKGSNTSNVRLTTSGDRVTRYVPSQGGAHGSGWWIACTTWYSSGPNGTDLGNIVTFSNAERLTG
jgi:hypothetical protein